MFLSNNGGRLPRDLMEKINRLGIPVSEDQVLNSAAAMIHALAKDFRESRIMVVGERRLSEGISAAGVELTEDPQSTDIVVVAIDSGFTYDKLRRAHAAILRGALFWATNLDPTFPAADGFLPGAGSIVAAVSAAVGRAPDRVFGKPYPDMARIALELLGTDAQSCLVVGDRMETDILFARNAGMDSALVLTGASDRSDLSRLAYAPDYVLESIADLPALFDGRS